jgi:hypothetical protein
MRLNLFVVAFFTFSMVACTSSETGSSTSASLDPGCVTVRTFTGSTVTLTGTADYQFRTNGNGAVNGSTLPIRQAQVAIYSSTGAEVQCGATDDSGNFSIIVPQISGNYTVSVDSRIYNSVTKAAVLNNPTELDVHSVTSSVSGATSASVGTLTATATGALKGGAFIYWSSGRFHFLGCGCKSWQLFQRRCLEFLFTRPTRTLYFGRDQWKYRQL